MREFETGATRNSDENKFDYEGFFNPRVMKMFAEYMHSHRKQADGKLRDSDNWQKGMDRSVFMKSLLRHVMDLWLLHRGYEARNPDTGELVSLEDALCGIMFNSNGYAREILLDVAEKKSEVEDFEDLFSAESACAFCGDYSCKNWDCRKGTDVYSAVEPTEQEYGPTCEIKARKGGKNGD